MLYENLELQGEVKNSRNSKYEGKSKILSNFFKNNCFTLNVKTTRLHCGVHNIDGRVIYNKTKERRRKCRFFDCV